MPPQQPSPDASVTVDRGAPGAAAGPCVKLEIVPIVGGAPGGAPPMPAAAPGGPPPPGGPGGGQQYALKCFRANSAQPDTAMAATPEDLMRLIAQALQLAPPQSGPPDDTTTESATAPAPAP